MTKFIHDHPDVLQVIMAHLGAITITFLDVENILKVMSLSLAILYTVWKWRYEWKKSKLKKK